MLLSEPDEVSTQTAKAYPAPWTSPWPQSAIEFEALVDYFQDRLVRFAVRKVGCLADAEDIVQEVFIKAFAQRADLSAVTKVAPYLYRMTSNLCTDRRRRTQREPSPDNLQAMERIDLSAGALERATATEELLRINKLLSCLPERQAEVLKLSVLDELSMAEIAVTLGTSIPTLKSRLRYGLEKLRRTMQTRKDTRS